MKTCHWVLIGVMGPAGIKGTVPPSLLKQSKGAGRIIWVRRPLQFTRVNVKKNECVLVYVVATVCCAICCLSCDVY